MKIYGIWTSDPSHRVQDQSKKKSFRRLGPWVISYRSSHKSPQSGNPMKSSSAAYGQTDEVRTIAYSRKYAKNRENLPFFDHYFNYNFAVVQATSIKVWFKVKFISYI
jgi:hypothetical protein